MSGLLAGRRGLITGIANDHSIAWGIARACADAGAEMAFTYQGEGLEGRVSKLAGELGVALRLPCDVGSDADLDNVFKTLGDAWGGLDFVVHAIAFSERESFRAPYVETARANFLKTMDISCYSFTAMARRARGLMKPGGALLTLSYMGAERVIPNYNVMGVAKAALEASVRYLAADLGAAGIRVNAISAGPVRTLSAAGIAGARSMFNWTRTHAPLRRAITIEDVGSSAVYFLSDMSSAITGEVHYVDAGYNITGMPDTSLLTDK